mgnify:CR=1 FL=1
MNKGVMIGGKWVETEGGFAVTNKYSLAEIAHVGQADEPLVEEAINTAYSATAIMASMKAHERSAILLKTAQLVGENRDEMGKTIAQEAGKAIKHALGEVDRCINTFTFAAEEAKRISGETVPLDAVASAEDFFGFWLRRPVGVVAAITPFNFPLNLVAHKIAPAIAAGNPFVLKPASTTPLVALKLADLLLEAGMPAKAVNVVCGSGATVGDPLVSNDKVAKVSFTGSAKVGRAILIKAGIKKVTLELGNTSPVIVDEVNCLEDVVKRCAIGAFYYQGQVCISVQRVYVKRDLYGEFKEKLIAAAKAQVVGDPLDEKTDIGPMIDEGEAKRVEMWVRDAWESGAKVETGGCRDGVMVTPGVLSDVRKELPVFSCEVFGPVVSVVPYDDFSAALVEADDTTYGLQAGVYTKDVDKVLQSIEGLNFGGVVINDIPTFRADHMPYGGNRQSGLGREGLRYAIEDMTNIQMVAIKRKK